MTVDDYWTKVTSGYPDIPVEDREKYSALYQKAVDEGSPYAPCRRCYCVRGTLFNGVCITCHRLDQYIEDLMAFRDYKDSL
jgi:hypothetical protein